MTRTVLAIFNSRDAAQQAVSELRGKGYDRDISIVAKDDAHGGRYNQYSAPTMGGDSIADGTTTGGVLGGLAGLVAGAGALAIPGIGPIIAAGPIAGMLSGMATGGIAGGLIDWGIPAERSRFYEEKVKEGDILVSVRCDEAKTGDAAGVLRRHGARDVETH